MPRWPSANMRIGQRKRRLCLIPHCGAICTEWTFGNYWREPKNGDSSEGADFRGGSRCEDQRQLCGIGRDGLILFIWLVSFNQTNQTDRID